MRATLHSPSPNEAIATFLLPSGEQMTIPLQPIPGAYAGRWLEGRLVEVAPVGDVLESLLASAPADV